MPNIKSVLLMLLCALLPSIGLCEEKQGEINWDYINRFKFFTGCSKLTLQMNRS